jgi:hypothetical protein
MSLTHPVFPPENNATTNLPTAFAQINTALRALDGADTLVIDAGATALETVLPRVPQVLAVHGAPGSLDGNGRYVLRLPSNGATDQILIVANRTASPLRLETADGANALVASLAAGRIEAFVLSGSTIGAYALSSTRTGKAATAHTHPLSEISNFDIVGQAIAINRSSPLSVPSGTTVAFTGASVSINTMTGATHDSTTGKITVPNTGLYRISGLADYGSIAGRVQFSVNGGAVLGAPYNCPPRSGVAHISPPPIALNAGDNVRMMLSHQHSGPADALGSTWFAVERIR